MKNDKLVLWLIPFLLVDIAIGLHNMPSDNGERTTESKFSELQMTLKHLRSELLAVKIMVKRCGAESDE